MEAKEIFLRYNKLLEPYYKAMTTASGITDEQARLCVAYAIVTHHDFDQIPVLLFRGALATGKSEAMKQLAKICKEPKEIYANTTPALRDAFNRCQTAIIDEADSIDESLIRDRYSRETGVREYKRLGRGNKWETVTAEIFGATILTRRDPIADTALRSRCIVIETKQREGNFHQSDVSYEEFKQIAEQVKLCKEDWISDRIHDTWKPILEVSFGIEDLILAAYASTEMQREMRNLRDGQEYDATAACMGAIVGLMIDQVGNPINEAKWIHFNKIRDAIDEHFCLKLRVNQAAEIFRNEGFEVKTMRGFPAVKAVPERIEEIAKSYGDGE